MTGGIIFWYRNHRGEERYRNVRPISLRFGATEWHPEEQWLMLGFDLEKNVEREFALRDARHIVGGGAIPFAALTAGKPEA
jgi:predicted DNA-binding transcriptional regulator YafY